MRSRVGNEIRRLMDGRKSGSDQIPMSDQSVEKIRRRLPRRLSCKRFALYRLRLHKIPRCYRRRQITSATGHQTLQGHHERTPGRRTIFRTPRRSRGRANHALFLKICAEPNVFVPTLRDDHRSPVTITGCSGSDHAPESARKDAMLPNLCRLDTAKTYRLIWLFE